MVGVLRRERRGEPFDTSDAMLVAGVASCSNVTENAGYYRSGVMCLTSEVCQQRSDRARRCRELVYLKVGVVVEEEREVVGSERSAADLRIDKRVVCAMRQVRSPR